MINRRGLFVVAIVLGASWATIAVVNADAERARDFAQNRPAASQLSPCDAQVWPYITAECLVSADGTPVKAPHRVVRPLGQMAEGKAINATN